MRAWVGLIVIASMTAGCIDDAPDADAPGTDAPRLVVGNDALPWGLQDCQYIVSFGWVEGDRLLPHLPEGFTPRPSPLVPGAAADTLFGFDVMTCTSGIGLNGSVSPMPYGYVWASADPPAAFLQDDVDASEHYAKWDVLVPDKDRREALAARGVPVRDGSASLAITGPVIEGVLRLDGLGTLALRAAPAVERESAFEGSFVKMSTAEDGAAAWRANATSGPRMSGHALLTFEPGSWLADVAGGTELPGRFHSGTWTYTDAEIRFLRSDR